MRSLEWLLHQINIIRSRDFVYTGNFKLDEILYTANYSYHSFLLKKKRGGSRLIYVPCKKLKFLQECIKFVLEEIYIPNPNCFGFIKGKSIYNNALQHTKSKIVYNLDLKDFFSSISDKKVIQVLSSKPYNFCYSAAEAIANICTISNGDVRFLPQGSPLSPLISNIIADRLDFRLSKLCNKYEIIYSRYADDLTFSFNYSCLNKWKSHGFRKGLKEIIFSIIEEEGFKINSKKTHISFSYQRQEVTGVIVNQQPNVNRKFVKLTRTLIHNWEKDGYVVASFKFNSSNNPNPKSCEIRNLDQSIAGKLAYIKMIKGATNSTFLSLIFRYKNVRARDKHLLPIINSGNSKKKEENIFKAREHYIYRSDASNYESNESNESRCWNVIKRRKLNKIERESIVSNLIIPGEYGNVVEFELKNGTKCFIPLSPDSIYGIGDSVDLNIIEILLLGFENKRVIYRISS